MGSITDVVKEGLKYPLNDWKKVLTLGVIFLVSSLVSFAMEYLVFDNIRIISDNAPFDTVQAALSSLPPNSIALIALSGIISLILMIFCSGYIYDVIKYAIEGKSELPGFADIKGLFVKGIRSFLVGIAYSILPAILFLLGLMLTVNEAVSGDVNMIGVVILLIAIVFAIFMSLVQIMALCNMIDKDEFAAAFRFNEIFALIKNLGWGRFIGILLFTVVAAMIISIFCGLIFGAIATVISIIFGSALVLSLVNMALDSLLLNPYMSIAISRVYGSIFNEANDAEFPAVRLLCRSRLAVHLVPFAEETAA